MKNINFYDFIKTEKIINPNYDKHNITIPFRMILAAPSGAGKTNFLMNLIFAFDKTFYKIIISVKNKAEPLYEMIEDKLDNVEIFEDGEVPDLTSNMEISKLNKLIIFDDLLYDDQTKIKQYFIRGRKKGYSCIYLTQSYFNTPKDLRLQCNYIVLGNNILKRDLKIILQEINTDLELKDIEKIYKDATSEPLQVLFIDLILRKFRKNIYHVITEF
jgi:hypothetical protein